MGFNTKNTGSANPEKCAKCKHRIHLMSIDEYTRVVQMKIKDPINTDATYCQCQCKARVEGHKPKQIIMDPSWKGGGQPDDYKSEYDNAWSIKY